MTGPATGRAAGPAWSALPAWVSTAARLVLGGTLVAAGLLKMGDPTESVRAVRAYQLLPASVEVFVGYTLPFAEVALGLVLVVGFATRFAAVCGGLLMLAFIGGVASAWARGLAIDCGCFGGGGAVSPAETAYGREILRDVGLLLAAAWLTWRPVSRLALDRWSGAAGRGPAAGAGDEPDLSETASGSSPNGQRARVVERER